VGAARRAQSSGAVASARLKDSCIAIDWLDAMVLRHLQQISVVVGTPPADPDLFAGEQ
jgi:hypothetical protein